MYRRPTKADTLLGDGVGETNEVRLQVDSGGCFPRVGRGTVRGHPKGRDGPWRRGVTTSVVPTTRLGVFLVAS